MHYVRVHVVDVYCSNDLDAAVLIPDAIALVFGPLPCRLVILHGRSRDAAAGLQQRALVPAVRGSSDRGVYSVVHEKRSWAHRGIVFGTFLRRLRFCGCRGAALTEPLPPTDCDCVAPGVEPSGSFWCSSIR